MDEKLPTITNRPIRSPQNESTEASSSLSSSVWCLWLTLWTDSITSPIALQRSSLPGTLRSFAPGSRRPPGPASVSLSSRRLIPSPVTATVGTTGTPRDLSSSSTSISIPLWRASSTMFRATTTGSPRSITCRARNRFRSRAVASSTRITASAPSSTILSATSSASLVGERV